jgi:HK97 gp10 family phage protein
MARKRAKITGWHRARRKLSKLNTATAQALRAAIKEAAEKTLADAKRTVPVDPAPNPARASLKGTGRKTGHLRDALRIVYRERGMKARIGVMGKRALEKGWNVVFVEFDVGNQSYRPFLRPAHRGATGAFGMEIRTNIRKGYIEVTGSAEPDR